MHALRTVKDASHFRSGANETRSRKLGELVRPVVPTSLRKAEITRERREVVSMSTPSTPESAPDLRGVISPGGLIFVERFKRRILKDLSKAQWTMSFHRQ